MPTLYDRNQFEPPAPVVTIEIIHPTQKNIKTFIEMQLDSGSDVTCIPAEINNEIPHLRSGYLVAEDYNGDQVRQTTRFITVKIGQNEFPAIEALEINGEIGLLGRDILNKYRTILNGPKLEFDLG
jgi:hypothetical protein